MHVAASAAFVSVLGCAWLLLQHLFLQHLFLHFCALGCFCSENLGPVFTDSETTKVRTSIAKPDVCESFSEITSTSRKIGTADSSGSLAICAEGSIGSLENGLVSENVRENVISVSQLTDLGYELLFTRSGVSIRNA